MNFISVEPKKIIDLLENCDEITQPKWGNFNFLQMIDHLVFSVKVSVGELEAPYAPSEDKAAKFQMFLESDHPMPKMYDAPFAKERINSVEIITLEEGKKELFRLLELFNEMHISLSDKKIMNPEFGLLTIKQWKRLHSKHFTHHFQQFGII